MLEKVIVIGSPGAGKSTFSRRLRDITGLPLYYLDMIWHKPDRTNISKEEFDSRLNDIISREKWIVDGNYQRTVEMRIKACDTVFLLDYPLEVCLSGAASRVGIKREEMPWVENELDPEFRQFIIDFQSKKLPEIYAFLEKYGEGREIIIFRSRQESEEWLEKIEQGVRFNVKGNNDMR
ncbi:MAG: adenylate kinase [Oscillospiraceae bacterium]|nr:adenylate kinase [Oscillospiraceae bacterium]